MKKTALLFIAILLLAGCSNEVTQEAQYFIDKEYYQVYTPYVEGVGKNYIAYKTNNNVDINDMKVSLMRLSNDYFSNNDYYYREGQYLSKDSLKELLNNEKLNKASKIKLNNKEVSPKYITYIEEQNYLDKNGKLIGISLGISLNSYQTINNSYSKVSEDTVIKFGEQASNQLLEYLRTIEELENTKIVIALYMQNEPGSTLSGNYKEIAMTSNNTIKEFKRLNEQYYTLKSSNLKKEDPDTYNSFSTLEDNINNYLDTFTAISGTVLYINNDPKSLNINIYSNSASDLEVLALSQFTAKEIATGFDSKIYTEVKIYNNYELVSLITRSRNYYNPKIHILD